MKFVEKINAEINGIVWGPYMLALLILMGLFLSVMTRFLQFRKFGFMLKNTIFGVFSKNQHEKDSSGVSPFQAVATAMAGTIGTGSIAGVATAIVSGGPGAIFWMWISALLGMVTKYSEIVLAIKYRQKNDCGDQKQAQICHAVAHQALEHFRPVAHGGAHNLVRVPRCSVYRGIIPLCHVALLN